MQLCIAVERFDPSRGTPIEAWVATRVSQRLKDHADRERKHTRNRAPMPDELPAPDATRLDEMLERLPEPQRHVAVACIVEGRDDADVAAELGVSLRTVEYRLAEAKVALRRLLTEE